MRGALVTLGRHWSLDNDVKLMVNSVRIHADPAAAALADGGNADSLSFVGRLQLW